MMRSVTDPVAKGKEGIIEARLYPVLNIAFHVLHIGIIFFTLFGWALRETRLAHLILILLTLGSWYILGIWLGEGYCPITDWHWRIRRKIRSSFIPDSYIKLVLDRMTGRDLDSHKVNVLTLAATLLCGGISLILNIVDWI